MRPENFRREKYFAAYLIFLNAKLKLFSELFLRLSPILRARDVGPPALVRRPWPWASQPRQPGHQAPSTCYLGPSSPAAFKDTLQAAVLFCLVLYSSHFDQRTRVPRLQGLLVRVPHCGTLQFIYGIRRVAGPVGSADATVLTAGLFA